MTDDAWVTSGISGLDQTIQGLRAGDNVVWQIKHIDEYVPFIQPFIDSSLARRVPLVYFRFARHRPLLTAAEGVEIITLQPEVGFERFVSRILDIVDEKGVDACYVFDCLSDLAVDWYSDNMLSNFFMITCPYLYKLDTIAYFSVDYSYHTKRAIDAITATAQVIIRTYTNLNGHYVQPLKATQRYSPTLFMLHKRQGEVFQPVTSSTVLSEILVTLPKTSLDFRVQRTGVWTRTFMHAQEVLAAVNSGALTYWEARDCFNRLLRMIATRDERIIELVESYLDLEDMVEIFTRMIGTGLIGGKSLGMLLARGILRKKSPVWKDRLETHDSFYIGSDVFYSYLVHNNCWWLRRDLRKSENNFAAVDEVQARILNGKFPGYLQEQFMEILDYFGQAPIIVRSSSLLEDNYGNAFSGKYDSVFCPNQLAPEQRLETFMAAVRRVYASALSREALVYRGARGLLEQDEQMALLVQRVSGDIYGDLFCPQFAGVGYSFNPYVWNQEIDPHSGFLRLVAGLGTRAVDRLDDDYARLVALNVPMKRLETTVDDIRRYSQHHLDVLDLPANQESTLSFEALLSGTERFPIDLCATRDEEIVARAREHGLSTVFPWLLTFDRLLGETDFPEVMRTMLATLESAYGCPVDIEFTVNFAENGSYRINLLQCRPFQAKVGGSTRAMVFPEALTDDQVLFRSAGPVIGPDSVLHVDRLVYVDPAVYSRLPEQQKYQVAGLVGRVCRMVDRDGKHPVIVLVGPGRWGTSSPSLGVPVRFSEISEVSVICELAVMHEQLIPDVSLGSHFFNDLVEIGMVYGAIMPHRGDGFMNDSLIQQFPNRFVEIAGEIGGVPADVIRVFEAGDCEAHKVVLHADSLSQRIACYLQPNTTAGTLR